jgi:predicted ATPase
MFLREAEVEGRATEAGAARRRLGLVLLCQGDLKESRSVLEQALGSYVPERDREAQFRFGRDTEVSATAYLALAEWHLGEIERARRLMNQANQQAHELGHVPTKARALLWKTFLEVRRDDPSATRVAADDLLHVTDEYGIKTYADLGEMCSNWALGRLADPNPCANELGQALAAYIAQGNRVFVPSFYGLLAELAVATRGPDQALTLIDQGVEAAEETGEHSTDPYLHRLRFEVLLKRDAANPAPAEEAFQTAIAIAEEQGARSYILLASLSLAKLYQSTARPDEAYAVLAPALEGFTPTLEMPEIAEAQALLEHLARGSEGAIASNGSAKEG